MNTPKYKGFSGTYEYSEEDNIFYGKLNNINSLVTFEAKNPRKLKRAFEEAVNDYIILCKEINK